MTFKEAGLGLDQPEAQLFFGMLNRTSCSKCKWRKGYSAFRSCTKQNGEAVKRLYNIVQQGGTHEVAAREKLKRWGFNGSRQCCVPEVCDKLLVRLPELSEVFPCVDYRDRMHGLTIFVHRVITETLASLSKTIISGPTRRMLDRRLRFVCERRGFRLPDTRRSYRVQKTIFSDVGMTATDRVCVIFLLPHVLGPEAAIVPASVREPLLTAISYSQLILIAVRGCRGYTRSELERIFDQGYIILFGALQSLLHIDYNKRSELHAAHPAKFKAPAVTRRIDRIWRKHTTPNTDTSDTSDDSTVCGIPKFSHGSTGLSHQHWVDQVISAGGFGVHCTQAAEAMHKTCMRLPAQRVRHLKFNTTQLSMLNYCKWHDLFSELARERAALLPPREPQVTAGVRCPISVVSEESFGAEFNSIAFQESFLHPDIRLAGLEFLDLLCAQFLLPKSVESFQKLGSLQYYFGQQLTRSDGEIYWATDSRYLSGRRRDILRLAGEESLNNAVINTLCCEAVAFVVVSNIHGSLLTLTDHLVE